MRKNHMGNNRKLNQHPDVPHQHTEEGVEQTVHGQHRDTGGRKARMGKGRKARKGKAKKAHGAPGRKKKARKGKKAHKGMTHARMGKKARKGRKARRRMLQGGHAHHGHAHHGQALHGRKKGRKAIRKNRHKSGKLNSHGQGQDFLEDEKTVLVKQDNGKCACVKRAKGRIVLGRFNSEAECEDARSHQC